MPGQDATAQGRLTPRGKRNLVVLITIAAVVLMLLAAEGAVRLRQKLKYGTVTTLEEYYTVDESIGLRVPIANFSSGRISINSLGFRGPEIAVPKPPTTVRIAFLGASTTFCGEVSGNEYVWPHLVTARLAQAFPAVRFDYVNAGVPGYTMGSVLKALQHRVAPLEPDVIVVYEGANNLSGELREIAAQRGILSQAKVHEFTWPSRHSLLWYLVEKNLLVLMSQRDAQSNRGRLEVDTRTLGAEYRRELEQVATDARRSAKLVALATFSTQLRRDQTLEQQMRASTSAFFYAPFATPQLLMDSYDRYNQILREVAREKGALLIEGEQDIPGDSRHFTDTVHFSDAGSRAMAERIGRGLMASPELKQLVADRSARH
jgi:lysophospholipase L1-like esterase